MEGLTPACVAYLTSALAFSDRRAEEIRIWPYPHEPWELQARLIVNTLGSPWTVSRIFSCGGWLIARSREWPIVGGGA